jgi:tight adherence protein B
VIRRLRRRRRLIRLLPLALAAIVVTPAAGAAVRVQAFDTSAFPSVRVTLVAPLHAGTPELRENGRPVVGYSAVNLGRQKAIVLALDRSQSMKGRPLREAVSAAQTFIGAAGRGDHVGLVAFGRNAFALSRASNPGDARSSLDGLSVDSHSGTALYDSIVLAARELAGDSRPGRAIVVVTDGRDVSSTHSIDDAIAAARTAHAAVYTIGIGGPSFTPEALRQLAYSTGGSYHQASGAAQLSTVYAALADELARTWQLQYVTSARPGSTLKLEAVVPNAGSTTRELRISGNAPAPTPATGLIPGVGYSAGGTLLIALASGLLVLLACGFWFAAGRGNALRARIEPHLGTVERASKVRRHGSRQAARTQISNSFEQAFGNMRQFKRLQLTIDRADLPLRAGELIALAAGAAFVFGLLTAVTGSPAPIILVGMAIGGFAPILYVSMKASKRLKQFENQLPDMLITIAASLKAGHSFRQGIQSVVDEGADPAAKEFRRVLTETQLGKPMDEALADLATRIDSKNLTFVINAVTIQRQIGGSLAGLFDMVADTVRQRQQFRRKVKGLTAQGRMSAYILIALPFFVAFIVSVLNPTFMAPLYHTSSGHEMMLVGLVMISLGAATLKKIVSFKG